MSFADDFLSFPAFVTVLNGMIGLFSFTYNFIVELKSDLNYFVFVANTDGIVLNLTLLLVIMLPGAAVNQVARISKETAKSLPWRFPQHYMEIKKILRQQTTFAELTLWKIYAIEKSLLVSALGTLVTYGFLVGTMGSIQNLDSNGSGS
ncbi:hypothetical protein AVEN_176395-1 [Araneus ventricosus]|uniref:Uncharacterized protein n=1 Tax=Araneus ventricosus TaxID=182803 RepID=A0A4Y2C6V9_ARAVE|nr:hypothetical protein AVEN_176395-1 [Araneus ventricosus]